MALAEVTEEKQGLALPAIQTHGGYFASRDKYDLAWSQLLIALFTPHGSRPMRRSFGSQLYESLFDPAELNDPLIEYVVQTTIETHCPDVILYDVVVIPDPILPTLHVSIRFGVAGEAGGITRLFDVNRADAMRALTL